MTDPCLRYRRFLETLTPETLVRLSDEVTEDVRFKDPFNDVRGAEAMAQVFRHMFDTVDDVRFEVRQVLGEGDRALMEWRFEGRLGGKPWVFDGTSALRFIADGRVAEHIDYWDSGRDFFERLPVIDWLLAAIRRRLAVR